MPAPRSCSIDRLPFLGGTSTAVLDTFYGFYTPGSSARKVVGGIGDDVVAALRELGPVVERPNTYGAGTGVTYLAEHLKVVWERLVTEAGARPLLHALVQAVEVRDGRVTSLIVATRAGLARVRARRFVDASGDADLCAFAGFGFETAGELDPAQTLTTTFRMANVDLERRRTIPRPSSTALMAEAAESGDYDLPRREGSDHITPVDGVIATIMTRLDSVRRDADGRHRQRHRPVVPDRGRDRRPPPGARVRPVPASTACPATNARRSSRSGRRSASARRGGSTATTG